MKPPPLIYSLVQAAYRLLAQKIEAAYPVQIVRDSVILIFALIPLWKYMNNICFTPPARD